MSRVLPACTALLLVACSEEQPSAPAPEPIVVPKSAPAKPPQIVPQHAKRMLRDEAAKAKPERSEPKRAKAKAPEPTLADAVEPAATTEPVP